MPRRRLPIAQLTLAAAGTAATLLPRFAVIAAVVAVTVFLGQRFELFGDEITLAETSAANLVQGEARSVELFRLVPRDGIRSIDAPVFVGPGDRLLPDDLLVIGVAVGSDARAYPIPVLARHEIVNDVVGGRPLAVTYCPLCLTAIVFDRTLAGELLSFGVSGKLLLNDLVMYDRQSNTLWSQLLGEAVDGSRKGERLVIVDSLLTTWASWRALHPATLVLDGSLSDPYTNYYANADAGVHGTFEHDDRLDSKAPVLGVALDGEARAYPFALAVGQPVINDALAGRPLLVFFAPDGVTGLAYDRRIAGRTLTFQRSPAGATPTSASSGSATLVDAETGSTWDPLTGLATQGPLRDSQLQRITALRSFWFGWSDFYTRTTIYQAPVP